MIRLPYDRTGRTAHYWGASQSGGAPLSAVAVTPTAEGVAIDGIGLPSRRLAQAVRLHIPPETARALAERLIVAADHAERLRDAESAEKEPAKRKRVVSPRRGPRVYGVREIERMRSMSARRKAEALRRRGKIEEENDR